MPDIVRPSLTVPDALSTAQRTLDRLLADAERTRAARAAERAAQLLAAQQAAQVVVPPPEVPALPMFMTDP